MMTNREKINELGGVLLEPEGSGSDKYFLMVSEKWLDSEYKEPDHIADTSEMVEPTKNDLGVDCIDRAQAQTEIEMNASRYTIAKERGGMGQVEWSDQLIKVSDAVDIIRHLPSVTPQEPTDKNFTKADIDAIAKAINAHWELIIDEIRAEIANYKLSEDELTEMDEDSIKWGMKIAYDIIEEHER